MMQLYAHPFSSYCWKVLIALYENATPFEYHIVDPEHPENGAAIADLSPAGKFPVLVDAGVPVIESTVIVEHLDRGHRGSIALIPDDPAQAMAVRTYDRLFDNYVMTPMNTLVADAMRSPGTADAVGVAQARAALERSYAWFDKRVGDGWAVGDAFTLADCAAAPALFYADWAHPIDATFARLRAYRARLLARPSVARAVDEARPYRAFFPLGAPDRD